MNYYKDIEVSNEEIISIGLISNEGDTFYSLVKPSRVITAKVSSLTGITNKDIRYAPYLEEVCKNLCDWVKDKPNKYLCYGEGDKITFIKVLKSSTDYYVHKILNSIIDNFVDLSKEIQNHFNLLRPVRLIKVAQYYFGDVNQTHNALDDAILLHDVYEKILVDNSDTSNVFELYRVADYDTSTYICRYSKDSKKPVATYENLDTAVEWVISETYKGCRRKTPDKKDIKRKISNAIKSKESFCGYLWERKVR